MDFHHNVITINSADRITKPSGKDNAIHEAIKIIESWDLKPATIIMNQRDYEDILKWRKKVCL